MTRNINIPLEGMRCGASPAGDRPRSPGDLVRDLIDERDRRDPSFQGYLPLRTCRCGTEMWLGSPADAEHQREHGDAPGDGTEVVTICEHCRKVPVAAGARFCSPRCQARAIRSRRPGDITG